MTSMGRDKDLLKNSIDNEANFKEHQAYSRGENMISTLPLLQTPGSAHPNNFEFAPHQSKATQVKSQFNVNGADIRDTMDGSAQPNHMQVIQDSMPAWNYQNLDNANENLLRAHDPDAAHFWPSGSHNNAMTASFMEHGLAPMPTNHSHEHSGVIQTRSPMAVHGTEQHL